MSQQSEAVKEQVKYIGPAKCDICDSMRADVAEFKAGFFVNGRVCDTCTGLILRGFKRGVGGDAE